MAAAYGGHYEVVKFLIESKLSWLEAKDISHNSAIHFAIASGNVQVVDRLVCSSARLLNFNKHNQSIFHRLALLGYKDLSSYVFEKVSSHDELQMVLSKEDSLENTPLHYAAAVGEITTLKLILQHLNTNASSVACAFNS